MGGGVGTRQHDCGRRVAVHIAVEQAQRGRDDARGQVVGHRHRLAHHRLRVDLGIGAAGQRDLRQLLGGGAELMEVPLRIQRHQVRRRVHAKGRHPLPEMAAVAPGGLVGQRIGGLVQQPSAGLGDGAEHQHMAAQAGGDRHRAVDHASQWARALVAAAVPVHLQPQRADQCVGPHWREAVAQVVVTGPAGHAVDVVALQPSVSDGLQAGVHGQPHGRQHRRPAHLGLAHAGDGHVLLEAPIDHRFTHHAATAGTGSNSGSHTSSCGSKRTCTGRPMCTCSGGSPTTLLSTRRPVCSASSTMATA